MSAIVSAPPVATGKKEGNIIFCGDSLTQPSNAQNVVSAMYWQQITLALKTYPAATRAGFGWLWENISTPSSVNIINAAYDASAPWNIVFVFIGPNNLVAGDTPQQCYDKGNLTWAPQIDARYRFLYSTVIPNGAIAQGTIDAYNALLKAQPYMGSTHFADSKVIDLTPLNGAPLVVTDPTYYMADHIHLQRAGQAGISNGGAGFSTSFRQQIQAYLDTLP